MAYLMGNKVFKGKYWQFQLVGFSLLFIGELFDNWGVVEYNTQFYSIIISNFFVLFTGFSIIHKLYKSIYRRIDNPFYFLIVSIIGSLICGFYWMELREILYVYVFKTKELWLFKGRQHSLIASVMEATWLPLVWSILYFGIKYWQDFIVEKQRANEAVVMAQKAQLQMLRYQLNPHFLFNSLNSIQALIHENPDVADTMVEELSDFLRTTLNYNEQIMISVKEEVEITRKYLAIEKIRFEERLEFTIYTDEKALDIEIPCFITQPLVENSIKHGLFNNPDGIKLRFNVLYKTGKLILEVLNSGELERGWRMGVGLQNVMERLDNNYPDRFSFTLNESDGFVIARILINLTNEKISVTDH